MSVRGVREARIVKSRQHKRHRWHPWFTIRGYSKDKPPVTKLMRICRVKSCKAREVKPVTRFVWED
jgi:hypothetical protein